MYLNSESIKNKQNAAAASMATPPLKRLRIGRKLRKDLTTAVNTPIEHGQKRHPFGSALMSLRKQLGSTPRYAFAELLSMTEQTLQKLETQPHRSGIQPMLKLLESFGLALTLDVPGVDNHVGYLELHEAFFALRVRNADLTQRVLVERSGVARTTIQNFEAGKPIKLSMLLKLVAVLGARLLVVPADQLKTAADLVEKPSNEQTSEPGNSPNHLENEAPLIVDRYAPTLAEMLGWEQRKAS